MPNTHGAILCSDSPFAMVESAIVCKETIDIVFGPHLFFTISGLGPRIHGVNVGKGVAREVTPPLAHLKNPVLVVVDDGRKGKRRDNTVQRRRQKRMLPF